jgi:hypothetical protein
MITDDDFDTPDTADWQSRREALLNAAIVRHLSHLDADALRRLATDGNVHVSLAALHAQKLGEEHVRVVLGDDASRETEAQGLAWVLGFEHLASEVFDRRSDYDPDAPVPDWIIDAMNRMSRDDLFELAVRHVIIMDPVEMAGRRLVEEVDSATWATDLAPESRSP